jgi:hypothetical protein
MIIITLHKYLYILIYNCRQLFLGKRKRLSFWDVGSISEVNERKQENLEETIEEK